MKKIKWKKPTSLYSCTPLLLSPIIQWLWLTFKEKMCPTLVNYQAEKGKNYHSKKEKKCPITSNNGAVKR